MPISADGINRIGEELAARTVGHGKHALTHQGSGGTLLFRRPTLALTTPDLRRASDHPFRVYNVSSGGTAKVAVRFGQVNSVTPLIGATAIGTTPAPELTVVSGVVYLHVVLDVDGEVDSAEIANAASLPANTEDDGYLTLAEVTASGTAVTNINQSVTRSLQHMRCGDKHIFGGL